MAHTYPNRISIASYPNRILYGMYVVSMRNRWLKPIFRAIQYHRSTGDPRFRITLVKLIRFEGYCHAFYYSYLKNFVLTFQIASMISLKSKRVRNVF